MNINDIIISAVRKVVDEAIAKAPFTKIRTGKILKKVGNKYSVFIDGNEYYNVPCYGSANLVAGDVVKIIIPENQASQMFILPPYPDVFITEP